MKMKTILFIEFLLSDKGCCLLITSLTSKMWVLAPISTSDTYWWSWGIHLSVCYYCSTPPPSPIHIKLGSQKVAENDTKYCPRTHPKSP